MKKEYEEKKIVNGWGINEIGGSEKKGKWKDEWKSY